MRTAATAALVCIASWIGLALGADNVGLQRSVGIGPLTLLEAPLALTFSAGLALGAAWLSGGGASSPLRILIAVLAGDFIGAVLVAPLLVGELEIIHAATVFVAISALGLQPLAACIGSWLPTVTGQRRIRS